MGGEASRVSSSDRRKSLTPGAPEGQSSDIAAFIDSAAEGTYRAALLEAQDDLDAVLRDPAIFGGWS